MFHLFLYPINTPVKSELMSKKLKFYDFMVSSYFDKNVQKKWEKNNPSSDSPCMIRNLTFGARISTRNLASFFPG